MDNEHAGEEIVFGQAVFSSDGEIITPSTNSSTNNTSIANLENDNEYQIIQVQSAANQISPSYINSFGEPE